MGPHTASRTGRLSPGHNLGTIVAAGETCLAGTTGVTQGNTWSLPAFPGNVTNKAGRLGKNTEGSWYVGK